MPCSPQGGVVVTCNSCRGVFTGPSNCPPSSTSSRVGSMPSPSGKPTYPSGLFPPEGAVMHWRVDIAPDGGTPVTAAQSPDLPYPEVVSGAGYVGDSKQAWEPRRSHSRRAPAPLPPSSSMATHRSRGVGPTVSWRWTTSRSSASRSSAHSNAPSNSSWSACTSLLTPHPSHRECT